MRDIGLKLLALLVYLALDAWLTWSVLTVGKSFIDWHWNYIHATPLGRAGWLALWLYEGRSSVPLAIRFAERRRARLDAQPTTPA
ncbi:hypothetical protein HNO88_001592 [Novosphingobium chloroacetimidivorans]|uniref:Uncharacterized protein n=1 Tax=Novosphingobium chloroacetimidivorans TaxID=1428314 RepID=A0A7W7KA08_9SPHN|nr:hypothetical protein [Novosphingobium chloroacetimidivorans]MBB4858273.1 hypothetical protein [Novosphingobium chloroacetimidivorans]